MAEKMVASVIALVIGRVQPSASSNIGDGRSTVDVMIAKWSRSVQMTQSTLRWERSYQILWSVSYYGRMRHGADVRDDDAYVRRWKVGS